MENVYLVNYYFNNMDFKDEFVKYLKGKYPSFQPMKNTIMLKCNDAPTSKELYCHIAPYITSKDKLLITPMQDYYGWLDADAWNWLNNKQQEKPNDGKN